MPGGIVFILVPVTLLGFVSPAPSDPAGLVMRFPAVRAAITVGNGLDFVANILLLALFLAYIGLSLFGRTGIFPRGHLRRGRACCRSIYVVLPILLGWKVYSLPKAA